MRSNKSRWRTLITGMMPDICKAIYTLKSFLKGKYRAIGMIRHMKMAAIKRIMFRLDVLSLFLNLVNSKSSLEDASGIVDSDKLTDSIVSFSMIFAFDIYFFQNERKGRCIYFERQRESRDKAVQTVQGYVLNFVKPRDSSPIIATFSSCKKAGVRHEGGNI